MRKLGIGKRTQRLASGITVRQDFRDCVRMVFFDTGESAYQYATHGGTAFVVIFKGRPYAFTCAHVRQDFSWDQLVITDTKRGHLIAQLKSVGYATSPRDSAIDTDVLDVVVIDFAPDVTSAFFKDMAYVLDLSTVSTSKPGDGLLVAGVLKGKSQICDGTITPCFCTLEFADAVPATSDPTLRHGIAKFDEPEFDSITGLSGAPVYNLRANGLCGMVVRGSMNGDDCSIYYIDLFDMMQILKCAHEGRAETYYRKTVLAPR